MNRPSRPPRFEDLLRELLDAAPAPPETRGGTVAPNSDLFDLSALEEAMALDPARRREYLEQIELDALLAWELGPAGEASLEEAGLCTTPLPFPGRSGPLSESAGVTPPEEGARRPRRARAGAAALLAAAAALAAVFVLGFLSGHRPGAAPREAAPPAAVLIEAEDCYWALESGREPGFGSAFAEGETLRIASGVARLALRNRAGLAVEGPAVVDLLSSETVRVREGRVSAYAPEEAIGFTLLTPGLEIVDLGTHFAAQVASDGSTEVHVFEGEVSVQGERGPETGGATLSELVTTGQARRYAANGGARSEIAIDPARFADPPDLEQLLAATGPGPEERLRAAPGTLRAPPSAAGSGGAVLAFQDFTRGEGDLDGRSGGTGFAPLPWSANRDFTRLIPSVLSHSGEAGAGGYLLVRGRDRSEPFIANRVRRELASALPEEFYFAIRASYHGLDEDDFFSLWIDTHGREDASHSGAPTLGIREGRFFARLDLEHSTAAGRAADGGTFLLAARHAWIPEEGRARIELWVDPVPGAPHDVAANGPERPDGPPSYRFLGLRMGKYTEVSDRLLVRGLALGRSLESVLEALAE